MPDRTDSALKRFSSSDLPQRDRFPFWRDFFAGQIVHCDVEVTSEIERFHAEAELLVWPELRVLWSKEAPMHYSRSRSQAADGDDSLVFLLRQGGSSSVSQRGNEVALAVGDAVGFLGAEPASAIVSEIECLAFVTPRAALTPMVGDVAGKAMRLVPRNCEALRLLTHYSSILRENPTLTTPEVRHLAVTHIHDLIAVALGATRDGEAIAEGRGIRAARLRAVKDDILANLSAPELTIVAVALRQGVTPRYVHMLFEAEGTTFSEYVLSQRLMRAHRMLTDPRFAGQTITTIAFASGFDDLSYFDRTFRRRFGATPSDVRHGFPRIEVLSQMSRDEPDQS
jgi:AraC-like DNA-binding protein